MSLKNREGAAGLTLTVADTVYLLEPCLNFGLEDQGIARIHRIGQARPTAVVRLIVKDTIEEKLLAIQQRKRGNVGLTQAQTTDEILGLVGIDATPDWFKACLPVRTDAHCADGMQAAFPEVYQSGAPEQVHAGDTDDDLDG